MAPKHRAAPNVADPLSETTPGRRVHAAYLRAGFTRAEFQRALGVSYVTVDNWDKGGAIRLENLLSAAEMLGYTMDELCYGHHPPGLARINAVCEAVRDMASKKTSAPTGDLPYPQEAGQVSPRNILTKTADVVAAAIVWWVSRKPESWTVEQHFAAPTHGIEDDVSKVLAHHVAQLLLQQVRPPDACPECHMHGQHKLQCSRRGAR